MMRKATIGDVVDYLGDETVDVNVLELSQQLPPLPTRDKQREWQPQDLDYPIIVVEERRTISICLEMEIIVFKKQLMKRLRA